MRWSSKATAFPFAMQPDEALGAEEVDAVLLWALSLLWLPLLAKPYSTLMVLFRVSQFFIYLGLLCFLAPVAPSARA